MYVKFATLPVDDVDRAVAFYTAKLRLILTTDAPYGDVGERWVELAMPEGNTALLVEKKPDRERGRPVLIFVVPDVGAAYDRLTDMGVEFIQSPTAAEWDPASTYATFLDSEGNSVLLSNG